MPPTRWAPQRRPPALQGSGLAAQPRRRCSSEESRVARHCPSVLPAAQEHGSWRRGRGGAGLAAWPPPRGSQLRPPPSSGRQPGSPGGGRSAHPWASAGCGVWQLDRQTGGWTKREREAALRGASPPRPKCTVTPGAPCPVRGGAGARPAPPTRASSVAGSPRTPRETDHLLLAEALPTASQKSRPRRHCTFVRIFFGSLEAPTCFQTKCEVGNSPRLFTTNPLPGDAYTEQTGMLSTLWSSTYRVREVASIRTQGKGTELGPRPIKGRGYCQRAIDA